MYGLTFKKNIQNGHTDLFFEVNDTVICYDVMCFPPACDIRAILLCYEVVICSISVDCILVHLFN